MTWRNRCLLLVTVVALILAPGVGAQRQPDASGGGKRPLALRDGHFPPQLPRIRVPAVLSTSWSDSFEDDAGLTWMENAVVIDDDVRLSQIAALGVVEEGGDILAITEAASGKIYLGTAGAYLNVYDPVAGTITSLGAPVPEECFG